MAKFKLEEATEKYKALEKKLQKLQSTPGATLKQLREVKKELEATSMLEIELRKKEDLERAKKAPLSKISQELFAALKHQLLEVAPRVKNVPDPKTAAAIAALKMSDCEIVSSKDNIIVLDAGIFGIRKIIIA